MPVLLLEIDSMTTYTSQQYTFGIKQAPITTYCLAVLAQIYNNKPCTYKYFLITTIQCSQDQLSVIKCVFFLIFFPGQNKGDVSVCNEQGSQCGEMSKQGLLRVETLSCH